jgi:3-oxoacyl-[acyl-carrier protein] reductase
MNWSVVGLDRISPQQNSLLDCFIEVDISNHCAVEVACKQIMQTHSSIWGIVHCAAIYPIIQFSDYTLGLWDEVFAVNTRAAFQIIQYLDPILTDGGRIVLISSAAAYLGSNDVAYSSSKAALNGLTRSLAKIFAPRAILVNCICPGPIESPMSERMSAESVLKHQKNILLGRFGQPKEVAVVAKFLLAPENTFITGHSIDVAGGMTIR